MALTVTLGKLRSGDGGYSYECTASATTESGTISVPFIPDTAVFSGKNSSGMITPLSWRVSGSNIVAQGLSPKQTYRVRITSTL